MATTGPHKPRDVPDSEAEWEPIRAGEKLVQCPECLVGVPVSDKLAHAKHHLRVSRRIGDAQVAGMHFRE